MGLLSWLFGSTARQDVVPRQTEPEPAPNVANLPGPGDYEIDIVGESHYQSALSAICGGKTEDGHDKIVQARLFHDDANPHDNMAIRVEIDGRTVGYLDRAGARQFRQRLAEAGYPGIVATCSAMIVGGWDRGDGDSGHFGVKLDLPHKD